MQREGQEIKEMPPGN